MNVQELRDAVRSQLDLDEEDLPNPVLDGWAQEAFDQTIAFESRWPFYSTTWDSIAAFEGKAVLPSNVAQLASVTDVETGRQLQHLGHDLAQERYGRRRGEFSTLWSVWGSDLYVYPWNDGVTREFDLRGWRTPNDWLAGGASAQIDCDVRLHRPLIHYIAHRAYAQQEDEVLSGAMYQTWRAAAMSARDAIMRPIYDGPFRLSYGVD